MVRNDAQHALRVGLGPAHDRLKSAKTAAGAWGLYGHRLEDAFTEMYRMSLTRYYVGTMQTSEPASPSLIIMGLDTKCPQAHNLWMDEWKS